MFYPAKVVQEVSDGLLEISRDGCTSFSHDKNFSLLFDSGAYIKVSLSYEKDGILFDFGYHASTNKVFGRAIELNVQQTLKLIEFLSENMQEIKSINQR